MNARVSPHPFNRTAERPHPRWRRGRVGPRALMRRSLDAATVGLTGLVLALPACSPDPASSAPRADREALQQAMRTELEPIVRRELRAELEPIVRAELRREFTRTSEPDPRAPRPDATASNAPGPDATENPGSPPADADIWNRPGTTIWPSPGGLRLVELAVGTGLEDKLPVGVAAHYPNVPEILFCYTVFENPSADQTITHVWRRSGRLVSRVELEVGKSPKWRTWSKQKSQPHWDGTWSCEVLGPDDRQLGLTVFVVGG